MKKMGASIAATLLLLGLTTVVVIAAAVPIMDGTNILGYPSTSWDTVSHTMVGLQVERGNGSVSFVLPRSVDHVSPWGLHGFVTLTDAAITNVTFASGFYVLEANGDDGVYGGSGPYNDELDWLGDAYRVAANARGVSNSSELEFWLMTNSARDGFALSLSYGFCPRMRIETVYPAEDPRYGPAVSSFQIGGLIYPYPATVPLANCQFGIDIKPGSYPNSVNINEHGVIPVAVLGAPGFDVTTINPATLVFDGLTVRTKGNGDTQCSVKDVSGANMPYGAPDGLPDLVCQFVDSDGYMATGNGMATVTGAFYDGTPISGTDEINLVNQ